MKPETREAFDEYVRTVAENRLDRDKSSIKSVAEVVVQSEVPVGDTVTKTTNAQPYADECITVEGVLEWTTMREYSDEDFTTGKARRDAVARMEECIENATEEIAQEREDEDS